MVIKDGDQVVRLRSVSVVAKSSICRWVWVLSKAETTAASHDQSKLLPKASNQEVIGHEKVHLVFSNLYQIWNRFESTTCEFQVSKFQDSSPFHLESLPVGFIGQVLQSHRQNKDYFMMPNDTPAQVKYKSSSILRQKEYRLVVMVLNDMIQQQTLICFMLP